MSIGNPAGSMTFAEYQALPEGSYNLIDGELIVSPAPSPWHQRVQGRLFSTLDAHVRAAQLGRVYGAPLDVVLRQEKPPVVIQPDVLFLARGGAAQVTKRWVEGPPDLVVEVVSPGNARLDMVRKLNVYGRFGVREYWLVFPELEQVQVLLQSGDGFAPPAIMEGPEILTSELLPGFKLPLPELFAPEEA
jgi:Uma2 family endonuclease